MKTTYFFLTLFLMAGNLFAELDASLEKELYYNLPEKTEIKFKFEKDINIVPNKPGTFLPVYKEDQDGDGIMDFEDWCPDSPKGIKVWTAERIKNENQPYNYLGCSFEKENSKETWLETEKTTPRGYEHFCNLYLMPSPKYRYFAKDASFTVQNKITLSNKDLYAKYSPGETPKDPTATHSYLVAKSKAGLEVLFECKSYYMVTKAEQGKAVLDYSASYFGAPTTIQKISTYFTLSNIPKPEIIDQR